nr:MAG TPA: polynucleotide kinase [Bacteriophage sp.]
MKRIILTRGIPASGKSTWAKQEVLKDPEHSIRINRDDLRNMCGKYWVPAREKYITACKGMLLINAINFKFDTIIIDEMNLNPKENGYLKGMVSIMNDTIKEGQDKYIIEVKDFTNVPLDVCLERDSKRENPIGEDVIRGIFNKYQMLYNLKETKDE